MEVEFHVVYICPCYDLLRRKYIKQYYYIRPSVFKKVKYAYQKSFMLFVVFVVVVSATASALTADTTTV
jgi:hypothetical protein